MPVRYSVVLEMRFKITALLGLVPSIQSRKLMYRRAGS